jgi:hypothetical protein
MSKPEKTLVPAQPGWYSVELKWDDLGKLPTGLREDAILAWSFKHYDKEYQDYQRERKWPVLLELSPATPVTLSGEAWDGCGGVVKNPDGTYWLQGSRLTRDEALEKLMMIQEARDRIEERKRA